jgi:hypothetical protein
MRPRLAAVAVLLLTALRAGPRLVGLRAPVRTLGGRYPVLRYRDRGAMPPA